jgi:hypothetical protein
MDEVIVPVKVVEHVHEVDVRVVGRVVGAEVLVDVAVGPVLRAHVVEVVGGGELAPVLEDVRGVCWRGVAGGFCVAAALTVGPSSGRLLEGVVLHGVAAPGGEVALGVGPGDEVRHVVLADRVKLAPGPARA